MWGPWKIQKGVRRTLECQFTLLEDTKTQGRQERLQRLGRLGGLDLLHRHVSEAGYHPHVPAKKKVIRAT